GRGHRAEELLDPRRHLLVGRSSLARLRGPRRLRVDHVGPFPGERGTSAPAPGSTYGPGDPCDYRSLNHSTMRTVTAAVTATTAISSVTVSSTSTATPWRCRCPGGAACPQRRTGSAPQRDG